MLWRVLYLPKHSILHPFILATRTLTPSHREGSTWPSPAPVPDDTGGIPRKASWTGTTQLVPRFDLSPFSCQPAIRIQRPCPWRQKPQLSIEGQEGRKILAPWAVVPALNDVFLLCVTRNKGICLSHYSKCSKMQFIMIERCITEISFYPTRIRCGGLFTVTVKPKHI